MQFSVIARRRDRRDALTRRSLLRLMRPSAASYLYHVIYYRHSTSLGAPSIGALEGGARLHATFFKILQFVFCCILPRVKPFIVERGNGKNHRSDRCGGAGRPIIPTSSRHLRCNARCYANVRLPSHNQPSRTVKLNFLLGLPP